MIEVLAYGAGIALIVFLWLAIQLRPKKEHQRKDVVDRSQYNIQLTRDQAKEFGSEGGEEGKELAEEIKLRLLDEESINQSEHSTQLIPKWMRLGLPIGIPLLALGVYWFGWGDPFAVDVDRIERDFLQTESRSRQEEIYTLFKQRANDQPSDGSAWVYLMQIQWLTQRFDELIETHPQADRLGFVDESSDQMFLLALIEKGDHLTNPHTDRVLNRVKESQTELPQAIELMIYQRAVVEQDDQTAFRTSERLLTLPLPHYIRILLENNRTVLVDRFLLKTGPVVFVTVVVPENLVENGWLTVLARAPSGGPPISVVRRPLFHDNAFGSFRIYLHDLLAMQPNVKLSDFSQVVVEARITAGAAVAVDDVLYKIESKIIDPNLNSHIRLDFESVQSSPSSSGEAYSSVKPSSPVKASSQVEFSNLAESSGTLETTSN